jgi:hypothetical protein
LFVAAKQQETTPIRVPRAENTAFFQHTVNLLEGMHGVFEILDDSMRKHRIECFLLERERIYIPDLETNVLDFLFRSKPSRTFDIRRLDIEPYHPGRRRYVRQPQRNRAGTAAAVENRHPASEMPREKRCVGGRPTLGKKIEQIGRKVDPVRPGGRVLFHRPASTHFFMCPPHISFIARGHGRHETLNQSAPNITHPRQSSESKASTEERVH